LVKVEGQGPFSETVDGVTISGTIEGDTITFETDPPTPITLVVKSGQEVEFFGPSTGGTFTNSTGQDISNVQFCLDENGDDDVTPPGDDDVTPPGDDNVVTKDVVTPGVTKKKVIITPGVTKEKVVVAPEKKVVVTSDVATGDTTIVTEDVAAAGGVLPETGGASMLAMGAGALLVAGGLLARRIAR
jgi:hypothetical protein